MPRTQLRLTAALLVTLLAACAAEGVQPSGPDVLLGAWTVSAIEGTPTVLTGTAEQAGDALTLTFEPGGRLSGTTGINRFQGGWTLVGDVLHLPPLATTKRAGPPLLMDQERHYLQALAQVAGCHRHGAELLLSNADGDELLRLDPADPR